MTMPEFSPKTNYWKNLRCMMRRRKKKKLKAKQRQIRKPKSVKEKLPEQKKAQSRDKIAER